MTTETLDVRAIALTGMNALQSGDAKLARRHFEQIVAAGQADASVFLMLAVACRTLKDDMAMLNALERALALEPRNLRALIMRGDYLASTGEIRAAVSFYGLVEKLAAQTQNLSPEMEQAVRRIKTVHGRYSKDIYDHLRAQLTAAGYDEKTSSSRFTHSLELLTGKKEPYIQQPRAYLFPELPQIQFYPRETFPWLDAVEAATDDICTELTEVLKKDNAFVPYLQAEHNQPVLDGLGLLNRMDWSAFFLWKNGVAVPENAAACPKTLAALEHVPLTRIKGRAPSILFSLLKPGARISPHTGFLNSRLICHLPLIVPPGCRFRVGNDVREWEKGKAWVFDDTMEHEAWNKSNDTRVVLIFDVWRPEVTEEERGLIAALMEAVDTYGSTAPAKWDA